MEVSDIGAYREILIWIVWPPLYATSLDSSQPGKTPGAQNDKETVGSPLEPTVQALTLNCRQVSWITVIDACAFECMN